MNPCTRGIQAMLYYVRVYPRTYARMDYRRTCVRVEYSRERTRNCTRVVVCTPVHIHGPLYRIMS